MSDMTLNSFNTLFSFLFFLCVFFFTAHSANSECIVAHRLLELLIQQDSFEPGLSLCFLFCFFNWKHLYSSSM